MAEAKVVGRIILNAVPSTKTDDTIVGYAGMGGQGVLAIPNVYNGWVQHLPGRFKKELTPEQRNPLRERDR